MSALFESFFAFWDAGEIEQAAGTTKLSYRQIGDFRFQFREPHYKIKTRLALDVLTVGKGLIPLFTSLQNVSEDATDFEFATSLLPEIMATLAMPEFQPVIEKLCGLASVDIGNGVFQSLDDDIVAEKVFGKNITLQLPVAGTAAFLNFGSVFGK